MRIAISGTHFMGKTTLIEDFLRVYPQYTYEEEPYYQLQEKHDNEFSIDPTLEDFIEQLEYSIKRLDFYAAQANVIFERCPIDFVAYSMYLAYQEGMNLEDTRVCEMFPEIKESLENLDLIVFLPMTKESPIRCPESEDENYRETVDVALKEIYRDDLFDFFSGQNQPQFIEIWGSPGERMKRLKFFLEKMA